RTRRHRTRHQGVVGGDHDDRLLLAFRAREIEDGFHSASAVSRRRKTCGEAEGDRGAFRMAMKPQGPRTADDGSVSGRDRVRARLRYRCDNRATAQIETVSALQSARQPRQIPNTKSPNAKKNSIQA